MARVTQAEVEKVFGAFPASVTDAAPFLDAADQVIDGYGLPAHSSHTTASLKEVARWLAAHFVEVERRDVAQASALDISVAYPTQGYGTGLKSTKYGARAILLDTSGILQAVAGKEGLQKTSMSVFSDANRELFS